MKLSSDKDGCNVFHLLVGVEVFLKMSLLPGNKARFSLLEQAMKGGVEDRMNADQAFNMHAGIHKVNLGLTANP